jgi:hypothetical protein
MAIEDPDALDGFVVCPDGRPQLLIEDPGQLDDENERWESLLTKLKSYVGYLHSPEFAEKFPGVASGEVTIEVVCRTPPSERMAALTSFAPRGDLDNLIQVRDRIEPSLPG